LKFTKEIKAAIIALASIAVLYTGINFLKGNSFLGGDIEYTAYFPNTGSIMVSSNVTLNGVTVGKVTAIKSIPNGSVNKKVKMTFNIQEKDIRLPKGTFVEIGSLDFINKCLIIHTPANISKGYYKPNSVIPGKLSIDMVTQVKAYADPISQRLQKMMGSIDRMVISLSSFWDTTATSEIEGSLLEVKNTIKRLGRVANELEGFIASERNQFSKIMSNVESITLNIRKSNDELTKIIGNTRKITDDFVSADFKSVILDAQTTIRKLNLTLEDVENGHGTLGKLIHDEKLYNELVETNKDLQNLVTDLQANPSRYVHFSVFGKKSEGLILSEKEELKFKRWLDTIPD
jgi:phospholipid/cholesterol/gamma-HCH transport system substrate-binding protein